MRTFYEDKLETVAAEVNELKKKLTDVKSEYSLAANNSRIKRSNSFDYRSSSAPPATFLTNGTLSCSQENDMTVE